MSPTPELKHLPHSPGVYLLRDFSRQILYIGKANDLSRRVSQYFHPDRQTGKTQILVPLIRDIDYIPCQNEKEALILEQQLIQKQKPSFNFMWKDDKSYPTVRLNLQEDFPRLEITRKRREDGAHYFGPYPKVWPVRQLLRYLWKKRFFPLRPCSWDFNTKKPLAPKKIQSCLYYHTQECPAPCAGRISRTRYRRIAQKAALFFKGRYDKLKTIFEREMREASRAFHYEQAAQARDRLRALEHIQQRVSLHELQGEALAKKLENSRAVTSLQQVLALKKPPLHIEAFDISHLFGKEPVGSMICFKHGIPFKNHYRKFKIRTVRGKNQTVELVAGAQPLSHKSGGDDLKMMQEVVSRRYKRLQQEQKALPDLVLVDGGKGQLQVAQEAFQKLNLSIPLLSLAKRKEEVFLPHQPDPLQIPRDSPALHLLQQVRDEAHRFGVKYHRQRRTKKLFSEGSA
ncbi:MAG: excinuclease ABC subunit UvrC [Elusimicrobia bacterium]|nr:excinuclease ABC subunit UvrC [Elusimicrobiota bacterium]